MSPCDGIPPSPGEPVVVYHHQPSSTPVVNDGLQVITHAELLALLSENPRLKVTKKPIPKGSRHMGIYQSDLWCDGEKEANKDLPNAHANLSDVKLSFRVAVERFIFGGFQELYILSDRHGRANTM